jgi:polysaccharide pyruvyl transferase CsaB
VPLQRGMRYPRILILAGDADGNLGDHAIVQSTCAALRGVQPDVEISVVSDEPERCRAHFGALPIPRGLRGLPALARAAARSDLVLCGGGGLFQDDDSLVKMPYWALRVAAARLLAPRVVAYSLGVGPLEAGISRWSARLAFACMERVAVRDERAREVAQPLARRLVELVPDPALALAPAGREAARGCLAAAGVMLDGRPLIGVAPRRWFPRRRRLVPSRLRTVLGLRDEHEGAEGRRLVTLLAGSLDRLARDGGAHIVFLPTFRLPHEGDDRVAQAIAAELAAPSTILRLDDAALYKAVCGELAILIAGRMHPAILAAPMGTPILALGYNPKFDGFFALLGREDQVVPVSELVRGGDPALLVERATRAWTAGPIEPLRIAMLQQQMAAFNRELLTPFGDGGSVLPAPPICH